MKCKKCGSDDIKVSTITEKRIETQKKGCLWWLFIGWIWVPVKWIFFTIPALVFKLFGAGRKKVRTSKTTIRECKNCGYKWS